MSATDLASIRNFYALDGNVCTSGQPAAEQFPLLRKAGIDVVINLARSDSPDAVGNEDRIIHDLGVAYEHIPVDFSNPLRSDLERFFAAMHCHQGKKLLVHCAYNWRVSVFMYLYRILCLQHPPADALRDLHAVWHPDAVWQDFMDNILSSATTRR